MLIAPQPLVESYAMNEHLTSHHSNDKTMLTNKSLPWEESGWMMTNLED